MIRTLIVDDEPLAHKVLKAYCDAIDKVNIVGNCYDGLSTINFLHENKVDLILLDIQMPDLSGIEILKSLEHSPKIIFTTAFSEYAIDGYNFEQVVDYLLKPISLSRFIKAINRVEKILTLEKATELLASNTKTSDLNPEFINIKENNTIYRLALNDILYFQSWGNYIKVYKINEDVKIFRMTFKMLLTILPSYQFIQIHKSYVANIIYITSIKKNQLLLNGELLPIGKSYSMLIKNALN